MTTKPRQRFAGIKQADGTTCYSGPECKLHGTYNRSQTNPLQENLLLSKTVVELAENFPQTKTRRGANDKENNPALNNLDEWSRDFWENLDNDEAHTLSWYSMSGFDSINIFLRFGEEGLKKYYLRKAEKHPVGSQDPDKWASARASEEREWVEAQYPSIDKTFAKHSKRLDNPQLLYKAFRVRGSKGKTTRTDKIDFVKSQYPVGKVLTNKAYTSTSVDPDYMLAFGWKDSDQVIVHEILAKNSGVPLHRHEDENKSISSIQTAEREVLLQRNTKLQVVGVKEITFESSYPKGYPTSWSHYVLAPERKRYIVVQMVEVD